MSHGFACIFVYLHNKIVDPGSTAFHVLLCDTLQCYRCVRYTSRTCVLCLVVYLNKNTLEVAFLENEAMGPWRICMYLKYEQFHIVVRPESVCLCIWPFGDSEHPVRPHPVLRWFILTLFFGLLTNSFPNYLPANGRENYFRHKYTFVHLYMYTCGSVRWMCVYVGARAQMMTVGEVLGRGVSW